MTPKPVPSDEGKPQKLTESGYKGSIADTAEGLVVAHHVYKGNPADAPTLEAAVAAAQATGMLLRALAPAARRRRTFQHQGEK